MEHVRTSRVWAKCSFNMLHQVVRVVTTKSLKQNSASTCTRKFFSVLSSLSWRLHQITAPPIVPTSSLIYHSLTIKAFKAKCPQLETASLNKPENEQINKYTVLQTKSKIVVVTKLRADWSRVLTLVLARDFPFIQKIPNGFCSPATSLFSGDRDSSPVS